MNLDYSIFDMLLEPLFILTPQGSVVYLNSSAAQITDLSNRTALRARHFLDMVHIETDWPELTQLETLNDPLPYKEVGYRTSTGRTGRAQIGLLPFQNNQETLWIMYFRDVTLEERLHKKFLLELKQREVYTEIIEQAHQDLARYSENLEKMVDQRTEELQKLNGTFRALLDALDQGFFIFDSKGLCLPVFSRSCEALLGLTPDGYFFADLITNQSEEKLNIEKWIQSLFRPELSFRELSSNGPQKVLKIQNRLLALNYFPLYAAPEQLDGVVVVVTDKTDLEEAEKEAERERAYSHMVINVVRRKKEIIRFIFDVQKILVELADAIASHYKFNIQVALRCLHTIKGGATTFAIYDLAVSCHHTEKLLLSIQSEGLTKEMLGVLQMHFNRIRYEFQAFLKGNEVLLGNEVTHGKKTIEIPVETLNRFINKLKKLPELNDQITQFEKDIFYVPIRQFLEGFEETTQALAMKLGKKLKPLIIEGGDILIHREHYSDMFSTLIHQLNNIVDHGIENPVLRRFHHKEEMGQIKFKIWTQASTQWPSGSSLVLQISDDGQGLDAKKIREQLSRKSIATDHLSDEEVLQYIFKSNITTTDNISQISGRGIGMEAIMFSVMDLKGHVRIESTPLKGTTLTITLPYSIQEIRLAA